VEIVVANNDAQNLPIVASWNSLGGELLVCRLDELHPHPSYLRHRLTVSTAKITALAEQQGFPFQLPIVVTRDRIIIDGYARVELARQKGQLTISCVKFDLSETQALHWLLMARLPSSGLNHFCRILLALDLEDLLHAKARSNQQIGGKLKGWSNLTKAEIVHVRTEIAKVARASVGNITKVKQILAQIVKEIIEALRSGEVTIHWAWSLRNRATDDQLDALAHFRFYEGLMNDARQRALKRRKRGTHARYEADLLLARLNACDQRKLQTVKVETIKSHGRVILITEDLARDLGWEQMSIC